MMFLGYGVVTLGTQRAGFTIGYGSNISGNSDEDLTGILILGGDVQLSNSVKLISENYIPIGTEDGSFIHLVLGSLEIISLPISDSLE